MAEEITTSRFESVDNEVTRALSGLKRVDAPKDFDFKVKARIANGRPQVRPTGIPAWVKAAVPLSLLLLVGAFFGLRYVSDPESLSVPPVASVVTPAVAVGPQASPAAATVQPQNTVPAVKEVGKADSTTLASAKKPVSTPKQVGGGSIDSAVRVANEIELKDVPLNDALQQAGVQGKFEAGSIKVDAADAKTGLKNGDVIESVNGRTVGAGSTIKGRLAGKTLRVRRDGKVVEVVVRN